MLDVSPANVCFEVLDRRLETISWRREEILVDDHALLCHPCKEWDVLWIFFSLVRTPVVHPCLGKNGSRMAQNPSSWRMSWDGHLGDENTVAFPYSTAQNKRAGATTLFWSRFKRADGNVIGNSAGIATGSTSARGDVTKTWRLDPFNPTCRSVDVVCLDMKFRGLNTISLDSGGFWSLVYFFATSTSPN